MKRRSAFTLIELLIAMALSAAALSVLFVFVLTLLRSEDKLFLRLDSLEGARSSLFRMTLDVRDSKGISPGSSGERLVLSAGSGTVSYDLHSGKVRREVNGSSSYLTEEGRVCSLRFSYLNEKLIKIEIGYASGPVVRMLTTEACVRN